MLRVPPEVETAHQAVAWTFGDGGTRVPPGGRVLSGAEGKEVTRNGYHPSWSFDNEVVTLDAHGVDRMSDPEAVETASLGPALTVVSPVGEDCGVVRLVVEPIRVGREADNDIVLDPDPAQVVSRQHCVIERTTRRWWVRDLESRNHTYLERGGARAQVDSAELLHGDAVCVLADSPEDAGGANVRYWRLAFTDPGETKAASPVRWLQYFPASETVWALGGMRLSRPVEAPPKARRMLLYMLARYRELDEPRDGVFLGHAELKAALWPEDSDPEIRSDGAVANVAWELRAALGDDDQRLLQTEIGAGYRLVPRP